MLIVFRVDAADIIGTGHVMRCLALANSLGRSGASVHFICKNFHGNLTSLIKENSFEVNILPTEYDIGKNQHSTEYETWLGSCWDADAKNTKNYISSLNKAPDWLIVDHYGIDFRWESGLRDSVKRIMVIDDLANRNHDCDILLDQNYFLNGRYRYDDLIPPSCTKLLGPKFALLRPEFYEVRSHLKLRSGDVERVLVFFGGNDSQNITSMALDALSAREFIHLYVDVVVGKNNEHIDEIKNKVDSRLRTYLHVQTNHIAELMSNADMAIGAGGTSTWERLCLGLPSLVVTIAENQNAFTADLNYNDYIIWLGQSDHISISVIQNGIAKLLQNINYYRDSSRKGMKLVPGDGTNLVTNVLLHGISPRHWRIRQAFAEDCELYWCWANDPYVRQNAINQEAIPWEQHKKWFHDRLNDKKATLFLVESEFGPVGQVRFQEKNESVVISYSIGRQFRGVGLGKRLMAMAIDAFRGKREFVLLADVKKDNYASSKIFEGLGFSETLPSQENMRRFKLKITTV